MATISGPYFAGRFEVGQQLLSFSLVLSVHKFPPVRQTYSLRRESQTLAWSLGRELATFDYDAGPKLLRSPIGRARKAFEEVSRLPRRQQDKIIEIVEAFVAQHSGKAS